MPEIQAFLQNRKELKRLVVLTKQTDSVYLEKRTVPKEYDPAGAFDFSVWKTEFMKAKVFYEQLHKDLLYTDEKQHFETAFHAFDRINAILAEIGE